MTLNLNPTYGSSFINKTGQANPQDVMRRIMEDNPDASEIEIDRLFVDEVINDPDLNRACLLAYAVNVMASIKRLIVDPKVKAKREKEMKKQVARAVKEVKRAFILDMLLPGTDKRIREATFAEVSKLGGAFRKLAKLGRPSQIVGDVVSDAAARRLYK